MTEKTIYETLQKIPLTINKINNLDYAPWANVWEEVLKFDDKAVFEVAETTNGFPAFINSTGGLVKVNVTIKGVTRSQWLALMSGYQHKAVPRNAITSRDVQDTIQRCLVKCVALFGLGLDLYQKDGLPEQKKG